MKRASAIALFSLASVLLLGAQRSIEPSAHAAGVAEHRAARIPAGWAGEWVYAGGEAERRALAEEIERVVRQFPPIVRGIARYQLRRGITIPSVLRIESEGSAVTIEHGPRRYTAPLDGSIIALTDVFGEPLELQHRLRDGALVETFRRADGMQRVALVADGGELRFRGRVISPRLPDDIEYTLTYRRR